MNRVVLITGVAGAIGRATAKVFADDGWHVVGVDQKQMGTIGNVQHFMCADVSDATAWQQIFDEILNKERRIDALINNAALQICKPLIQTTPEEWDAVMASNVRSVYLSVRHTYPLIRSHAGTVVNIGSVHSLVTSANMAAYAASKGALLALTRALAMELAPDRVRVNAVLPGAIDTAMLRAGLDRGHLSGNNVEEMVAQLGKRHALGRVGQPEEIAQAILFLADNKRSSFITGQAMIVDGGATARLSTE